MKRVQRGTLRSRARLWPATASRGRRVSPALVVPVVLVVLVLGGCDAVEPGPVIGARPPVVSDFVMAPGSVDLDSLALTDGAAHVALDLSLRAEPGDAPLDRVAYAVQWQFACGSGAIDASGVLEPTGDGRFAARSELLVTRGRRGAYRVTVWAVDAAGRPSNEAATTFTVRGENQGPPTASVEGPATFRPPGTLRFVVRTSDPDGVDDVARAEVDTPAGGTFSMAHTDTADNRTPCDGVFSASFSIPAGVQPGPQTFVFRAYDRDGLVSASVPFTVQITS